MTKYLFQRKADAEGLLELLHQPVERKTINPTVLREGIQSNPVVRRESTLTTGWLFQTPAGGIPAKVGVVCGTAECKPYYINKDDEWTELTDSNGDSLAVKVYNIMSSAVAGDTHITAKNCYGKLVADAENCG